MLSKLFVRAGLPVAFGSIALPAFAAVPESVTTAITAAQTDAVTVAGLMIGVVAALLAFKYIRSQMH